MVDASPQVLRRRALTARLALLLALALLATPLGTPAAAADVRPAPMWSAMSSAASSPAPAAIDAALSEAATAAFARRQALRLRTGLHPLTWAGSGGDGPTAMVHASPVVPGSLLVTTDTAAADLRAALPGALRHALAPEAVTALADGVLRVGVAPEASTALRRALLALPGVADVAPERRWTFADATAPAADATVRPTAATGPPDDPRYGEQWAHSRSDATGGWAVSTGSDATTIAIVDSGLDAAHPDLRDRVAIQEIVRTGSGGRLSVDPAAQADNDECQVGHGTAVAGVAAAAGGNGEGITGVAWRTRIVDVALSSVDSGVRSCDPSDAKVIAALGRLASPSFQGVHGRVDVVNLSLGGVEPAGRCPTALQRAIDGVVAQGTVVVAAAGNHADLSVSVPALCHGVISVGAVGATGARARYSAMARSLDLTAPGGDTASGGCSAAACILTTERAGTYRAVQGTSFAAPYVSGAVALLRTVRPSISTTEAESVLERTARHPMGPGVHDHRHGWGEVQLGAALRMARDGVGIPAPRTHPAVRIAAGTRGTAPIPQAVATSQAAFPVGGAFHAVLARDDDFADALAGSSLTYGIGPLLFTQRSGRLAPETAAELRRILSPGAQVHLLGGPDALDAGLEEEIAQLGFQPKRLRGATREGTAVAVARELRVTLDHLGAPVPPAVAVANRGSWADAVSAGSLGAAFGLPILLTDRDGVHPATAAYLHELRASATPIGRIYALGGPGVLSAGTADGLGAAAGAAVQRLSGSTRDQTAIAVARELERQLAPDLAPYAIAIDLDRGDGFAHALSASALAGRLYSVFAPIRGTSAPQRLTDAAATHLCASGADALLAGDTDLLPDALGDELVEVLAGRSPRCAGTAP